jgi:hypothetical protein
MAAFTGVAVVGIVVGARLVRHVPQAALKRGFAVFLLVMGGFILFQNRVTIFAGGSPPEAGSPAEH